MILIGTSGWHYAHWVGPCYPESTPGPEFLAYYTSHFGTVEINNTFYQLPAIHTLRDWHAGTSTDFLLARKGNRFITHMKKLKDPRQNMKRFFRTIEVLGKKLKPILFPLPPCWGVNATRLENFLKILPKPYRYAFEFRCESWFDQPIYDLLAKNHAALCLYHLAGRWAPGGVTADFAYIGLHGPDGPYQEEYDDETLRN